MKKRNLLVITLLVVTMILVTVVPASASPQGCTPGYWKQPQHSDSWVDYSPDDYFDEVMCWDDGTLVVCAGPHITLLDALSAKNKDYPGGEAALLRHAVAGLLNDAALEGYGMTPQSWVVFAYKDGVFEYVKDLFEERNEQGCPLN